MERLLASSFTPRQMEIVKLIADGFNSKAIGGKLGIARGTVEAHMHAIRTIAQVNNVAHLVAKLMREKIID